MKEQDPLISTEGQQVPDLFVVPKEFTDIDGTNYTLQYKLPVAHNGSEFAYLYCVPEPDNPKMTRHQKIMRPSYIKDVLEAQEKERAKEAHLRELTESVESHMLDGQEFKI